MTAADKLHRAREALLRREWVEARTLFAAADGEAPLGPADLERLAVAAYLTGGDDESADAWTRAHHVHLSAGDVERAVRCAFWLAYTFRHRGESARGSGWAARARRLLDDAGSDCVERGYLLMLAAVGRIYSGDPAGAHAAFGDAAAVGARFGDADLVTWARHGRGRALIRQGEIAEGVALLDEAMAAVEAGEVSAMIAGDIYCSVIEACQEMFDLRRAREWTAALHDWCESQPDLVPYRGQCLVRRAEIFLLCGAWPDAMEEALRAAERLSDPPRAAAGAAVYQQAELHRLRGELDRAEEAYRRASTWGRKPEPGLALLRLVRGQLAEAEAAIRRAVGETSGRVARSRLLPAYVEIVLAAGDVESARTAAEELAETAAALDAPLLRATAAYAQGGVRLAGRDAAAALPLLRSAWTTWQSLDARYDAARARVMIGLALRQLGDDDSAELEFGGAREVFRQLGAAPDLARLAVLAAPAETKPAGGLTRRELDVLRRVAAGMTNRQVAGELFISEKTVARHVSNIFGKLGLSTRAAAAAYAHRNGLA